MANDKNAQLGLDDFHPANMFSAPPECAPSHRTHWIWLVPILVVGALWFTPGYGNGELTWSMANKIAALAGLFILAFTFLIGPLSKFFPHFCGPWRCHRKFLGICGVAMIAVHVILSTVLIYKLDFSAMFLANAKWMGFYAAVLAFLIFVMMVLTSTPRAMKALGYKRWKELQMVGYLALALAIAHFFLFEIKPNGMFQVRPLGYVVMAAAVLALLARALAWLLDMPARKKFSEHFHHEEERK